MLKKVIAIVDDEPDILELVSIHLKKAGFTVREFQNADGFFRFLKKDAIAPELVILDLMLDDMDGLDILKHLKKQEEFSSISVIVLTAKAQETDKVVGLELGADDYITKPFSPKELVARVKAVLRRKDAKDVECAAEKISIGNILVMDLPKYEVFIKGKRANLTTTEFKILKYLMSKKGRVFTRDQILDCIWGAEKAVLDRTVDVHIKSLREKLGAAKKLIKNIRGVGYKVEEPNE